jgi:hypothetical protein
MEILESTEEIKQKIEVRKFHKVIKSIRHAFNSRISVSEDENEIITGKDHMVTEKLSQQAL